MLPRTVHCKLLRSTVPHGRIRAVDVSRARAMDGVHLVLTGDDFPIAYGILPVSQDEHALCRDLVRFVGDPVAAVIARDEQTATEALDLIRVDYEVLHTFAEPEDSLRTPEPRIHDYGDEGNIHKKVSLQFGDVDAALAGADHVFDDVFFFEGSTHLPIEQHATVAIKDPDGKLVVYSSTQTPHYLHRALAKALEMPAAHIRVVATPNGGGFGGKSDPFNHEVVVARAAMILDRPVKICLTREEVFLCHRGRHPVLMRFRTGVSSDGKIAGLHLQTLLDGGAYGSYGVASTFYTGALQTVTYQIPKYRFQGCRVFTNKPPCGPEARARHAAEPLRPGSAARQDRRAADDRPRRPAAEHDRAGPLAHRQLPPRRHHRPGRVHPARGRSVGLAKQARTVALRPWLRPGLLVLPLGCRAGHLLERHAPFGGAAEARSQRRGDGVLRRHRDRSGVG